MDLASPPATRDERIVELDFGFTSGEDKAFVLKPDDGDRLVESDAAFVIHFTKIAGTVTVYKNALTWSSSRETTLRWPIKGTSRPDGAGVTREDALPTRSADTRRAHSLTKDSQ